MPHALDQHQLGARNLRRDGAPATRITDGIGGTVHHQVGSARARRRAVRSPDATAATALRAIAASSWPAYPADLTEVAERAGVAFERGHSPPFHQ
jgi:hypothetical protein